MILQIHWLLSRNQHLYIKVIWPQLISSFYIPRVIIPWSSSTVTIQFFLTGDQFSYKLPSWKILPASISIHLSPAVKFAFPSCKEIPENKYHKNNISLLLFFSLGCLFIAFLFYLLGTFLYLWHQHTLVKTFLGHKIGGITCYEIGIRTKLKCSK